MIELRAMEPRFPPHSFAFVLDLPLGLNRLDINQPTNSMFFKYVTAYQIPHRKAASRSRQPENADQPKGPGRQSIT
jgi:hypothetical protein